MSRKWVALFLIVSLTTTFLNLIVLMGHGSPATARAASSPNKLLEDEDFQDGLMKIIRKTVRTYCTVGRRESIDC
jgi:hypothetical protein